MLPARFAGVGRPGMQRPPGRDERGHERLQQPLEGDSAVGLHGHHRADALRIGHLDGDYYDPRCTWLRHRPITSDGAVLVRPDRFIAWRHLAGTGDARGAPRAVKQPLVEVAGLDGELGRVDASPAGPASGTNPGGCDLWEASAVKAAVIDSLEVGPRFADFAEPAVDSGETLVEVTAAGPHPIVRMLASGEHCGSQGMLPMIPVIAGTGRRRIVLRP